MILQEYSYSMTLIYVLLSVQFYVAVILKYFDNQLIFDVYMKYVNINGIKRLKFIRCNLIIKYSSPSIGYGLSESHRVNYLNCWDDISSTLTSKYCPSEVYILGSAHQTTPTISFFLTIKKNLNVLSALLSSSLVSFRFDYFGSVDA